MAVVTGGPWHRSGLHGGPGDPGSDPGRHWPLPGNVEVAVEALVGQGLDVVGQVADVTDSVAVRALAARRGALGKPDLLVCAAGVMNVSTAKTLRTEQQEPACRCPLT